jgi:phenylacetic acid degradation operon negative regulatory protein
MPTDVFLDQTAALRALGGQRVWSLMVSLFGDLAQAKGQSIDGPLLSAIMQRLEIKPEATRVALHRLRKDGWITSERSGRISHLSLTAEGRAQSAAASPRIYADPNARDDEGWQLVLLATAPDQAEESLSDDHFVMVAPRVFVGPSSVKPPPDALALPGAEVPDWLRAQTEPSGLRPDYLALLETLQTLAQKIPDQTLPALDTAVLRCLIVHNWRRLVLKHPMLPAPLTDPDWPGHQCHIAVWELLHRFPRPALADLEKQPAAA